MSETPNLNLPLLAAAQAQKHVTMNEALTRLDALSALSVRDDSVSGPAANALDGDAFIVGPSAGGDWTGHGGDIAFYVNGGWDFAVPKRGWRAWILNRQVEATWTGAEWTSGLSGPFGNGAHTASDLLTGDEIVPTGGAFATTLTIPDRAVVLGVTARVLTELTGDGLSGWRVGVPGATDRYGSGIGLAQNSSLNGVTGSPVGYYDDTPLTISPEGGVFAGGVVRFAIHCLRLSPPDAV